MAGLPLLIDAIRLQIGAIGCSIVASRAFPNPADPFPDDREGASDQRKRVLYRPDSGAAASLPKARGAAP